MITTIWQACATPVHSSNGSATWAADLLRVANICPIHKVLSGKIAIKTAVLS